MRRLVLVTALALLAVDTAGAQDGNAILRRIEAAYGALRSYSHKASTTEIAATAQGKRIGGATNELRFSRPDKVYVSITSPQVGLVTAATDGKTFIGYRSSTNLYRRKPAPATLLAFDQAARGVGITNLLDPMYFLIGKKAELAGVRTAGKSTVNGVSCNVVTGTYRAGKTTWTVTLYAEAATSLLRKTSLVTRGVPATIRVPVRHGGKVVQVSRALPLDISVVTIVQQLTTNTPLPDSAFQFRPPAGAVEQKN